MFFFVNLGDYFALAHQKSPDLEGLGKQKIASSSPDWAANHTEGFSAGQPSVPVKSEISSGTFWSLFADPSTP